MQTLIEKSSLDALILKVEALHEKLLGKQQEKKEWLEPHEVMEILKISPRCLQTYRDSGKIGFSKIGKKKIYYSRESVDKLLQKNFHKPFNQ
jgi:hypothetical protein